jgi:hypothetical protein
MKPRLLISLLILLVGCQTEKKPINHLGVKGGEYHTDSNGATTVIPAGPDNPHANVDALTDPCAARMHDLAGAMLLYYAVHKKMPDKLEELKPLADADQQLSFVCPKSNLPYGYVPEGLGAQGKKARIVVFDSTPVHNGFRWCMMVSPSKPGSITVDVVPLSDALFHTYKPDEQPPQ